MLRRDDANAVMLKLTELVGAGGCCEKWRTEDSVNDRNLLMHNSENKDN